MPQERASQLRAVPGATPEERAALGRAARKRVPRSSHGAYEPPADRPDPLALLEAQSANRVRELIPIRYGRMTESPFRFYRGPRRSWPPTWPVRRSPGSGPSCAVTPTS